MASRRVRDVLLVLGQAAVFVVLVWLACLLLFSLQGCACHPLVVTEYQRVEIPIPVPCQAPAPPPDPVYPGVTAEQAPDERVVACEEAWELERAVREQCCKALAKMQPTPTPKEPKP